MLHMFHAPYKTIIINICNLDVFNVCETKIILLKYLFNTTYDHKIKINSTGTVNVLYL